MRQPLFGLLSVRSCSRSTFRLAAVSLALTITAAAAQAQTQTGSILPGVSQPVTRVGTARPIKGWIRFCDQNPAECAVDPDEPTTIDLTAKDWQTLNRINQQVNGAIKAKTDMDHWGVEDIWDFAEDGYGDCEDYQLVKRKRLVEAGGSVGISVYGPGSLSQPKAAFEENGELGFRHAPLPWRHLPLFLCLPQDQEQQLERTLVRGKVAAGPHRPAQFGIQRLDGIGRIDDPAHLVGKGKERDHCRPVAPPGGCDGLVLAAPG
jgi:predicted transglutaminase-like cysteine proteinase